MARLVDDVEDVLERPPPRVGLRPARERLRHRVHERDAIPGVGRDHGVADALERHAQPRLGLKARGRQSLRQLPRRSLDGARVVGAGQQHRRPRDQACRDEQRREVGHVGAGRPLRHQGRALVVKAGLLELHGGSDRADAIHRPLARVRPDHLLNRVEAPCTAHVDRLRQIAELGGDQGLHLVYVRLLSRVALGESAQSGDARGQVPKGGVVRRQVLIVDGDEEAALAGLGVLQQRQDDLDRFPDNQGLDDEVSRLAERVHLDDGEPSDHDEQQAGGQECDDTQTSGGPERHRSSLYGPVNRRRRLPSALPGQVIPREPPAPRRRSNPRERFALYRRSFARSSRPVFFHPAKRPADHRNRW